MTTLERALGHLANTLVATTGVVYAVMRYLMRPPDEWAVVSHPWQPHVLHLHVLAAPLLVFMVGYAWHRHALPKLRNGGAGRRSGLVLMAGFVPMAASGALIQVAVAPGWRGAWVAVHLVASGLWIVGLAVHQISALIGRADTAGNSDASPPDDTG